MVKKIIISLILVCLFITVFFLYSQSNRYRIYGTVETKNEEFIIKNDVRCTYQISYDENVICSDNDNGISFKNKGCGYGLYTYEFTFESNDVTVKPVIEYVKASADDKSNIRFVFDMRKNNDKWNATVDCYDGGIKKTFEFDDIEKNGIKVHFFP